MVYYVLFCIITLFTGLGILRLTRISINPALSITLAPVVTLSFWVIPLAWGVLLGFPIKQFYLPLWMTTFLLMTIGFTKKNLQAFVSHLGLFILALLMPILIMLPYFWFGLSHHPGNIFPDAWAYLAIGQYLFEYPRGTEGGLAPLYQFATYWSKSRFISASILAYISPLAGAKADTQIVSNLFLAWAVFVLSASITFFALTRKLSKFLPFYLPLVMLATWHFYIFDISNFDNLLALSFLPAFAGIATFLKDNKPSLVVILTLFFTASLYIYPEMSPCIVMGGMLFLLNEYWQDKSKNNKEYLILMLSVFILVLILLSPFLKQMIDYFFMQFHSFKRPESMRPGGPFHPEFLNLKHILATTWGLNFSARHNMFAALLTLFSLYGFVQLYKKKEWALMSMYLFFLSGFLLMLAKYRYSYGAYKFMVLGWWIIIYTVCLAASDLLERAKKIRYKLMLSTSLVILFCIYFHMNTALKEHLALTPQANMSHIRSLSEVKKIIGDSAIQVEISNWYYNEWAIYYLRNLPIQVMKYDVYFNANWAKTLIQRATPIDKNKIHYVLTDRATVLPFKKLVWSSQYYYLWSF